MSYDRDKHMYFLATFVTSSLMDERQLKPLEALSIWEKSKTRKEIIDKQYDEITPAQACDELEREKLNSPDWFSETWPYYSYPEYDEK